MKTFTRAEIARHMTLDDCWMIIKGRVYDVTTMMDSHPGGSECLMDCAGVDATAAFDDVGHSEYAWNALDDCFLGVVENDPEALEPVTMDRPPHAVAGCSTRKTSYRISKRTPPKSIPSPLPSLNNNIKMFQSLRKQHDGEFNKDLLIYGILAFSGLLVFILIQYYKYR